MATLFIVLTVIVLAVVLVASIVDSGSTDQKRVQPKGRSRSKRAGTINLSVTVQSPLVLEGAKKKFRTLVREHLPDLVQKRINGIHVQKDGVVNAAEWNAECQLFVDTVVRPSLTNMEAIVIQSEGLSRLATELIEDVVKAECIRLEACGHVDTTIKNYSGSGNFRTDITPITTKQPRTTVTSWQVNSPAKAGNGNEISQGLIIRQEPLDKILRGDKTWEMRSRPIKTRGSIALIQKGSKAIYGVADLLDCKGPLSRHELLAGEKYHQITPDRWSDPDVAKYDHAWVLGNVRRLSTPVPYVHSGGVQFVTLDEVAKLHLKQALAGL